MKFFGAVLLAGLIAYAGEPPQALLEELEALAAGEPPILGIDTQLRAGRALGPGQPALARRFLGDALSRTQALTDLATRGSMMPEIVRALAPLDLRAAEGACQTLTRRPAGSADDYLADCYGALVNAVPEGSDKFRIARTALLAGAFDTSSLPVLLKSKSDADPQDIASLYAAIVDAFPQADANPAEVRRLLECVRIIGTEQPAMSRQALERALRAIRSRHFTSAGEAEVTHEYRLGKKKIETTSVAEALQFQIASLARWIAPDLYEQKDYGLLRWNDDLAGLSFAETQKMSEQRKKKPDEEERGFFDAPAKKEAQIGMLDFDEALSALRKEKDPFTRVSGLLELIDRKGQPLPRLKSLAAEALEDSARMAVDGDRLVAQSMLTRRFWIFGDKNQAAHAAGYLEESFRLMCRCEDGGCDTLKGRRDCPEAVWTFAEYLYENHVSAQDLGLKNPSLRSRMMVLELEEVLKSK